MGYIDANFIGIETRKEGAQWLRAEAEVMVTNLENE